MDFKRFKNIIIIVLIIINIFFCGFLIKIKVSDGRVNRNTRQNVIDVLAKENIVMEIKDFPESRREYSACYVSRFLPSDKAFIKKMAGDGGSFSEKNEVMTFKLKPSDKQKLKEREIVKTCRDFMKGQGIGEALYKEVGVEIAEKTAKVRFCLEYDGAEFFDSFIEFNLNKKGITKVKGKNFIKAEKAVSSYASQLLSTESVLVGAIKDKKVKEKTEVEKVVFGYYLGNSADVYISALALPVWEIEFSDGDKLYYDARNGNLINI